MANALMPVKCSIQKLKTKPAGARSKVKMRMARNRSSASGPGRPARVSLFRNLAR